MFAMNIVINNNCVCAQTCHLNKEQVDDTKYKSSGKVIPVSRYSDNFCGDGLDEIVFFLTCNTLLLLICQTTNIPSTNLGQLGVSHQNDRINSIQIRHQAEWTCSKY